MLSGLLQLHDEVDEHGEKHDGDKGEREVDQGECESLNHWVIHRCQFVPVDDGSLGEERWDLVHAEKGWDEDSTVVYHGMN